MHDAQQTSRSPGGPSQIRGGRRAGASMLVVALAFFLASAGNALLTAQAPGAQTKTVWDGVYTEAQAARGNAVFDGICSRCHTLATQGTRPLSGEKFWAGYTQKSVGDLLTFVSTNMPNGNGGSLPASNYNDVVALILQSNGFPPGTTELAPATVADVQIIPKDGPGELPANTLVRVVGCLARSGSDWVLTSATTPERVSQSAAGADDATRPLGDRTIALKFVLTRLDSFAGQRMSVSGLLLGAGGVDGINVTAVQRVAESCP